MRMKRLVVLLCATVIVAGIPVSAGANVTPLSALVSVEEVLYGEVQAGSLLERIERVENDIYGKPQEGAVLLRIDRVQSFLESTEGKEGSLKLQLNLAEWGFMASLTDGQPLIGRLEQMESELYGTPQSGPIADRVRDLMMMVWGTTNLDVKSVTLPAQSLVKVVLTTPVDSGKSKEGDAVKYRVVEDVMVDGRVVIPAGAEGQGRVAEVHSAGRLGKDGRIVIDFGRIPSLDGTMVKLRVDQRATEENKSMELAAGASMAGVLLLGPVGLVGGYFVKGKDVKIDTKTEFYVETERSMPVSGFFFRPAPL